MFVVAMECGVAWLCCSGAAAPVMLVVHSAHTQHPLVHVSLLEHPLGNMLCPNVLSTCPVLSCTVLHCTALY